MSDALGPLVLIFQLPSAAGAPLPAEGADLRESLGFRPMALAAAAKESYRPTLAFLTDDEDLQARAGQLAARCGIVHAPGATVPTRRSAAAEGASFVTGSLLTGPRQGFEKIFEVLAASGDPREAELARAGDRALTEWSAPEIACGSRSLRPGSLARGGRPLIAGILNVTPDSFSDGGAYLAPGAAVARGLTLEEEGADLVDVGGESTRPGSDPVPLEEESSRVVPVIEELVKRLRVPVSIDTMKAEVARRALEAGASIINDVSGSAVDGMMPQLAAAAGVPLIVGHMRGTPKTMQEAPGYTHPVLEVLLDLAGRVRAVRSAGVRPSRILVDPGIGFGKRHEDNLALLKHLRVFRALRCPVMVGVSRKSFLGALTDRPSGQRLPATLAAEVVAAMAGADLVRTHEPAATLDALRVVSGISGSSLSH